MLSNGVRCAHCSGCAAASACMARLCQPFTRPDQRDESRNRSRHRRPDRVVVSVYVWPRIEAVLIYTDSQYQQQDDGMNRARGRLASLTAQCTMLSYKMPSACARRPRARSLPLVRRRPRWHADWCQPLTMPGRTWAIRWLSLSSLNRARPLLVCRWQGVRVRLRRRPLRRGLARVCLGRIAHLTGADKRSRRSSSASASRYRG